MSATIVGLGVAPALFRLSNLSSCNPLQVTSTADDGSCGTLRPAIVAANSGPTKTVTIELEAGSVIGLATGLTLSDGVVITTTAKCGSGPPITITSTTKELNSGDGLTLGGNNKLYNLVISNFGGRQIIAPVGTHTIMQCVRARK